MNPGRPTRQRLVSGRRQSASQPVPLADAAYHEIKRMFLLNELVAGQKLRYQDIARRLLMSQTPVIQALTRLENEGLVASEANKGFYVPELDLEEARQLYDVRLALEVHLVQVAAGRATPRQLNELEELMDRHRKVRGEAYTRDRLWCDARLHLAVAAISGQAIAERYLRQVFERLILRYRPERLGLARMAGAEDEHRALLAALTRGDADEAARVLKAHISAGSDHVLEGLRLESQYRQAFTPWE